MWDYPWVVSTGVLLEKYTSLTRNNEDNTRYIQPFCEPLQEKDYNLQPKVSFGAKLKITYATIHSVIHTEISQREWRSCF